MPIPPGQAEAAADAAAYALLYRVQEVGDRCTIETRVCGSSVVWSVAVGFVFAALAFSIGSIVWLAPKLPAASWPVALLVIVPAVVYWWRMPRDVLGRLARFGQTLEMDRQQRMLRHRSSWVFGFGRTRQWRCDQIAELLCLRPGELPPALVSIRLKSGESVELHGRDFDLPQVVELAMAYLPGLRVTWTTDPADLRPRLS